MTPEVTQVTFFSPEYASNAFATAGSPVVLLPFVPVDPVEVVDELPPPEPPPHAASEPTQSTRAADEHAMRHPLIGEKNMHLAPRMRAVPSPRYLKMFTARAATSSTVIAEIDDSITIIAFARRVSGIASVGLNAIAFVNET